MRWNCLYPGPSGVLTSLGPSSWGSSQHPNLKWLRAQHPTNGINTIIISDIKINSATEAFATFWLTLPRINLQLWSARLILTQVATLCPYMPSPSCSLRRELTLMETLLDWTHPHPLLNLLWLHCHFLLLDLIFVWTSETRNLLRFIFQQNQDYDHEFWNLQKREWQCRVYFYFYFVFKFP